MNPRLPRLPTWGQFLAAARAQGCQQRIHRDRVVLENIATGMVVPLPPHNEADAMTQFMTEYLSRLLRVQGFDIDYSPLVAPDWRPSPSEEM